ncbi:BON domain-containing protein [Stieleria sp. ICT_E10.1]|uniref:BON domain-containing protein n=1 Tax=Stieleria sedimenti TaxID=2976331 RepID=UPI00217FE06F|nr:BON domain-containing protein [Stieleria sedimenti]MCS7470496.1 BON domain-containing protein [Stieleria sedimenti]
MVSPNRITRFCRSLSIVLLAAVFAASGGSAQAQDGAEDTGGTQFQGAEPDLSVFEGIERGDSIGTSTTQGFGIAAEGGGTAGRTTGGAGGGGFGGGGLGGLFGALGGAFGGQGTSSQKPIIRVRLRSAIEVPPRAASEVQQSARRALNSLPPSSRIRGVNVTMNGPTAILSGTVASEKDRRMSELLMRLEPGVKQVDNQVVVDAAGN